MKNAQKIIEKLFSFQNLLPMAGLKETSEVFNIM